MSMPPPAPQNASRVGHGKGGAADKEARWAQAKGKSTGKVQAFFRFHATAYRTKTKVTKRRHRQTAIGGADPRSRLLPANERGWRTHCRSARKVLHARTNAIYSHTRPPPLRESFFFVSFLLLLPCLPYLELPGKDKAVVSLEGVCLPPPCQISSLRGGRGRKEERGKNERARRRRRRRQVKAGRASFSGTTVGGGRGPTMIFLFLFLGKRFTTSYGY